jgi:hypothetical protein
MSPSLPLSSRGRGFYIYELHARLLRLVVQWRCRDIACAQDILVSDVCTRILHWDQPEHCRVSLDLV